MSNVIRPTAWQQDVVSNVELAQPAGSAPIRRPSLEQELPRNDEAKPTNALTWRTRYEMRKALDDWRVDLWKAFPENAHVLRLAWALEAAFGIKGYARVADSSLASKVDLPLRNVQAIITRLERLGAIARTTVVGNGKTQRRIWPARIERDRPHASEITTMSEGGEATIRKPTNSEEYRAYLVDRLARFEPADACDIARWFHSERGLRDACGIGPDIEDDGQEFVRLARARRDELLGRTAPTESGPK